MALRLTVNPDDPSDRALLLAAEVILAGGVLVYPTETLYGLGVNAWNAEGVRRVLKIKRRPENKPILLIVHTADAVVGLTDEIPDAARALMRTFWPGPLTLLFRAASHVPPALTQGSGKIGLRVPASPMCLRLLEISGLPLTATSANISGSPAPDSVDQIEQMLGPGIDLYLDGGRLKSRQPSTVVDVSESGPRLVREGVISLEKLQEVVSTIDH